MSTFIDANTVQPNYPSRGQRNLGINDPGSRSLDRSTEFDPGPALPGVLVRVLISAPFIGPDLKKLPKAEVGDYIRVSGGEYVVSLVADGYVSRELSADYQPRTDQEAYNDLDLSPEDEQLIDANPLLYLVGEESYQKLTALGLSDKGSVRQLFMREGAVPFLKVLDEETTEAVLLWAGEIPEIVTQRIGETTTSDAVANEWYTTLRITEPQIATLMAAHLTDKKSVREYLDLNGIAGLTRLRGIGTTTAEKLSNWAGWSGAGSSRDVEADNDSFSDPGKLRFTPQDPDPWGGRQAGNQDPFLGRLETQRNRDAQAQSREKSGLPSPRSVASRDLDPRTSPRTVKERIQRSAAEQELDPRTPLSHGPRLSRTVSPITGTIDTQKMEEVTASFVSGWEDMRLTDRSPTNIPVPSSDTGPDLGYTKTEERAAGSRRMGQGAVDWVDPDLRPVQRSGNPGAVPTRNPVSPRVERTVAPMTGRVETEKLEVAAPQPAPGWKDTNPANRNLSNVPDPSASGVIKKNEINVEDTPAKERGEPLFDFEKAAREQQESGWQEDAYQTLALPEEHEL